MKSSHLPALIFLHIPKTGGQSVSSFLHQYYKPEQVCKLKDGLNAETLELIRRTPHDNRLLVAGHLRYGLHRHLGGEYKYIAFVREPVARGWSHYRFALRSQRHHAHHDLVSGRKTVEQYLAAINNDQARYIAGTTDRKDEGKLIESALNAVGKSFAAIGITERFNESIVLLRRLFGWKMKPYLRLNAAPKNSAGSKEIPPEARNILETSNQGDIILYNKLVSQFDKAIASMGTSFRRELALQNIFNAVATKCSAIIKPRR